MSSSAMVRGIGGVRRFGLKAAGLCVLGAALVMGGCNNGLKDENAALQQEAAQLRDQNATLASQQQALSQQLAQLQAQMQQQPPMDGGSWGGGRSEGRSEPRETVIEVAGDVLFDPGSATLKSSAKRELDRVVSDIRSRHDGRTVRIVGHTDSDPIRKSKWPSNEALSKARADAVRDYLANKGISRGSISTVGKGASEPRSTKAASRRVEIVIVDRS